MSAYKLNELKKGMWVWDNLHKDCIKITNIYKKEIECNHINEYRNYQENRYYPVKIEIKREEEKEMKAKEMFNKLGFEYSKNGNSEICYTNKFCDITNRKITFEEYYEEVSVEDVGYQRPIDKRELKAIIQQAKELGWLD